MKREKDEQSLTRLDIEELLNAQTLTILSAVDERMSVRDKKMEQMEMRINRKIDRLTTTLDKFLKRMTDMEDEFEIMKHDINQLKKIIQEKLGVNFSSPR